jgi:transcriptional regulator with XRE-family HTH domain
MSRPQHSERYKRLCVLLTAAREGKSITQSVLAKRLGKPQSYVSKYESGERRLDFIEFLDVAAALGVRPQTFISKI